MDFGYSSGPPASPPTVADVDRLLQEKEPERPNLEYKSTLPPPFKADPKQVAKGEFLKDVSAFLNSGGGLLLYGVESKNHIPSRAWCLTDLDADSESRRLDDVLRTHLDPPPPAGAIIYAPIATDAGSVLALVIQESTEVPHQVRLPSSQGVDGRFWMRGPAGAIPMHRRELGLAFHEYRDREERARELVARRLDTVKHGLVGPWVLFDSPRLVTHLVPIAPSERDLTTRIRRASELPGYAVGARGSNGFSWNSNGWMLPEPARASGPNGIGAFTVVGHGGFIELAGLTLPHNGLLSAELLLERFCETLRDARKLLKALDIRSGAFLATHLVSCASVTIKGRASQASDWPFSIPPEVIRHDQLEFLSLKIDPSELDGGDPTIGLVQSFAQRVAHWVGLSDYPQSALTQVLEQFGLVPPATPRQQRPHW